MNEINYEDFNEIIEVFNEAKKDGKIIQKISNQQELKLGLVIDSTIHWCNIYKIPDYIDGHLFDLPAFLKILNDLPNKE